MAILTAQSGKTYNGNGQRVSDGGYAIKIPSGVNDVTITNYVFGGNGGIEIGRCDRIKLVGNTFDGLSSHAFVCREHCNDLHVISNVYKNLGAYGAWELYSQNRLKVMFSEYINCKHGGHLLGPRDDCVLSNNWAEGLTDWLFEIQDSGTQRTKNLVLENNVALNYRKGLGNTGFLGFPCIADGILIRNNYGRANFVPGATFAEGHLHVCFERNKSSTGERYIGNIVGSERNDSYVWVTGIGYEREGVVEISGNRFYGKFANDWGGNGTPVGGPRGWWDQVKGQNQWDSNYANMPAPPKKSDILSGGTIVIPPTPTPEPTPTPGTAPQNVAVKDITDTKATITWTGPATTIQFMPGNPADAVNVNVPVGATSYTFTQGKPNWKWTCTVANGTAKAAPVTFQNKPAGTTPPPPAPTINNVIVSFSSGAPFTSSKPVKNVVINYLDNSTETKP